MALTNDQLDHLIDLGDLQHYDGKIKGNFYISKQTTAESGYAATYVFHGTSNTNNVKINIPKDYLVKSAEVKTCTIEDEPVEGYVVGDKYIDFTVNTVDGTGNTSHIYIAVKELVTAYSAGDGINITANNAIEVKTGNGIQINATSKVIEAKLGDGLELSGSTDGEKSIAAKVDGGLKIDSSSKAIVSNPGLGLKTTSGTGGAPATIDANVGSGLEIGTTGTDNNKIIVKTGNSTEVDSTSGAVEVKIGKGLVTVPEGGPESSETPAPGLNVKIGNGLEYDNNGAVKVKPVQGGVITVSSSGVSINTGDGLKKTNTYELVAKVHGTDTLTTGQSAAITVEDYTAFNGADIVNIAPGTAPTASATKNETINTVNHTYTVETVAEHKAGTTPASHNLPIYYATYGDATATTGGGSAQGGTDAKSGLMSGTDKDGLDALINVFGTDVAIATTAEIDELFPTV